MPGKGSEKKYYCRFCEDEKKVAPSVAVYVCALCVKHACWEHYAALRKQNEPCGNRKSHDWQNSFEFHRKKFPKAAYCQFCEDEKKVAPSVAVYLCAHCGKHACWEHYSSKKNAACEERRIAFHDWRSTFKYHGEGGGHTLVSRVYRKPTVRGGFPDAKFCAVCELDGTRGSKAQKICAYCGVHLCLKHFSRVRSDFCERDKFDYLQNYYLHDWWDTAVYHNEEKWPPELAFFFATREGTGREIEIVGFRNNKLVVKSKGARIPSGGGKLTRRVRLK